MTLIAPDRKTVLVHVPRTGGTSRAKVLSGLGWEVLDYKAQHHRLRDLQRFFGVDPFSLERVICVTREPLARERSQWLWSHQEGGAGGAQFAWPRKHAEVNTFVQDWHCHPLFYYEQAWHAKHYPRRDHATLADMAEAGGYAYWLKVNGEIPANVVLVDIGRQEDFFSDLLGSRVAFPRLNEVHERRAGDEYSAAGREAVRAIYHWSYQNIYQEALA